MKSIRFPLHDLQEIVRGRYRCPRCKSIGTWNPHGGLWDQWSNNDKRRVRRWMCKWCGLYHGPEGWDEVVADLTVDMTEHGMPGVVGVWQLVKDAAPGSTTPQKCLTEHMGRIWPWRY